MYITFKQLQYFTAVAEELHFGRAAERLHVSQPPLSQAVRQVEEALGVRLFDRGSRHVELTAAGRALLREARRILADVDESLLQVRRMGTQDPGGQTRTIGVATSLTGVVPLLAGACVHQPTPVGFEELSAPSLVSGVREGALEFGLTYLPVDATGLVVEPLVEDSLHVAVRADHPMAGADAVRLLQLEGRHLVENSRELWPEGHDTRHELLRRLGIWTETVAEATTDHAILAMVSEGVGVGVVVGQSRRLAPVGVVFLTIAAETQTLAVVRRQGPRPDLLDLVGGVVRRAVDDYRHGGDGEPRAGAFTLEDAAVPTARLRGLLASVENESDEIEGTG